MQYQGNPNIIPPGEIDPIGKAILNLYPQPNLPGEFNNYIFSGMAHAPDYQFDIKVDHQINDRNHISGRYSRGSSNYYTPMIFGDSFDNNGSGDGFAGSPTLAQNGSIEYSRTVNSRIVWTSHFAIDRVHEQETLSDSFDFQLQCYVAFWFLPASRVAAGQRNRSDAGVLHVLGRANCALDRPLRSMLHQHYLRTYALQLFFSGCDFQGLAPDEVWRRAETFL